MDKQVLQDLYDRATSKGYRKSIEEFEQLIGSNQEVLNDNFEYVQSKGYRKDISEFSKLVGFGEKKNPIVTPSDGEEVLTESTTETETPLGSSDGLKVVVEKPEVVVEKPEIVVDYLQDDFDVLKNISSSSTEEGFETANSMRARVMRQNTVEINPETKKKILSDYNIQKAIENDIIDESLVDSALKGNKKSIEKLQQLAKKTPEEYKKLITEGRLDKPYAYQEGSDLVEFKSNPEDKLKKLEAIQAVKSFDDETKKLVEANPQANEDELYAIMNREGGPSDEQYELAEDNSIPTGFEDTDVSRMYNVQSLRKIKGFNIKDFDGYLNEQGYKEEYLRLLDDETIAEDGRSIDYSGGYNPSLASERVKLQFLTNYINNQVERNVESQVLKYQLDNEGRHPSFDDVELSFSSGVDSKELTSYIEDEFPIMTSKLKERDVKNQELYQAMKSGEIKGGGQAFKQGWRSITDRINSFSAGVYDLVGADSIADEVRMNQAQTELEREDFMRYTYASGKESNVDGTSYLIDDNGQIYDTDLGLRVTNVLSPREAKRIQTEVGKYGNKTSTFSATGTAIQGTGIAADMLLQIALTKGVGTFGKGVSAGLSLTDKGSRVVGFMSKIPMKATTASAMVAQGTLFATNLSEQSYKQALDNGLSIEKAQEVQSIAGSQGLALGVLTAPISTQTVAMDKIFGKSANNALVSGALKAYEKAGAKGAKAYWARARQKASVYLQASGQEVIQENIQQVGQSYVIGKNVNEIAGKEIMANTISGDEFINTTILSAAAGFFMPFGGQLVSNARTKINKIYKPGEAAIDKMNALYTLSVDVDKTTELLNSQVTKGLYTEEQVKNILSDIDVYRNTINSIPNNLSPETALNVMNDIQEIKKQEELKKQLDPSFHQNIDEKILSLRNNIIKKTNFDYLDNNAKVKLKDAAIKELTTEAQERGEKEFTIDNSQATYRAIENFNNLTQEEQLELAKIKIKTDKDAISEPSTEKQVLPDDAGSQEEGGDSKVGLQQVGEGDTQQVTTDTQVEEGDTKTDQTSDTTTKTDTEQVTQPTSTEEGMSVNKENKIESFANRLVDGESTQEFGDEAQQFYAENQSAIDELVIQKRKDVPKNESKTRRLATKIANGDTNFSNEQIDLYASNEADVKAEVEAIAKTNSQTVTADTYKGILKSIKSTTRTDKAKQEGENAQRKRFWKSWNKSSRETKKDLKTKRKELNNQIKAYAKGKKGTISSAQTKAIINKVNSINLDNELKVQELIDYSEKVFNDADYVIKEKTAIKLNEDITKKLNSGDFGLNTDLNTRLSNILNTPIGNLTSENIDAYNDFLKKVKTYKKNKTLLAPLVLEAQNLFDSLYIETPEVNEEVEVKETKKLENIVDKIIDPEVSGETLLKDNIEFIENDLGKLDSFALETLIEKINAAETDENTDIVQSANEYAKNRQKVLNNIKSRSKGITLKNLDNTTREAGDVDVYKNIKDSDIVGLTGNQLMELEFHLENINEGFYTHAANKLGQSINSRAQDMMPVIMKYGTKKHKAAMAKTMIASTVKNLATNRGVAAEMMRSNPLSVIDNVFGNYKNQTIRNNTFTPIATKYVEFKSWAGRLTDKLDAVEKILAPSLNESINKAIERQFEVTAYLLALESESNPGVKGVDTANSFIDAVIKKYNKDPNKSKYNKTDIEALEAIKEKYSENGVVTTKKMDESLSPKVKKAINIMRDVYGSLSDKQAYVTTIVRGNKLDLLNNYVHHKMDVDKEGFLQNSDANDAQLKEQINYFNKASTKSKTSISRTGISNNKSIDFSPVSTALRALRAVGMDYYLTNEIQTQRKALNELTKITERNTDRKEVVQATKDLQDVYNESIDNVIGSNFSTDVVGGKYMDIAKRIGYYGTLASIPRAAAELGSNLAFAVLDSPLATMDGMSKYGKLGFAQNGLSFVEAVKATSLTKLYNSEILSGSKTEQGGVVRNKKNSKRSKETKAGEATEYVGRFTSQGAKGIEFIADNLLSTPDKMISRPLFFGTFGRSFKASTGQEMDVNKISENDQEYMEKYADAIKEATIAADKAVTQAATSNDPFSSVLKNQLKSGPGNASLNTYRTINSYMARFSINEYATARQAVASMVGQGDLSPIQGAAQLTAVLTRMSLYVLSYKFFTSLWQSMLGIDDEDEVDYEELAVRQAVGAGVSLITRGVSGNVPMILPNAIIEELNKEYGEELGLWTSEGDEGYNPYKHSLIFSTVNTSNIERKGAEAALINVLSGPIANQVNASLRVVNLLAKMKSDDPNISSKAYEQFLSERTAIEMLNIPGAVPFYKDLRRYFMAKDWSKVKAEKNKPKPLTYKEMLKFDPIGAAKLKKQKDRLKKDPRFIQQKRLIDKIKRRNKKMKN